MIATDHALVNLTDTVVVCYQCATIVPSFVASLSALGFTICPCCLHANESALEDYYQNWNECDDICPEDGE